MSWVCCVALPCCLFDLARLFLPSECLGCAVLLCLVVCLTLLAYFFLPSHLSLKHDIVYCLVFTLHFTRFFKPVLPRTGSESSPGIKRVSSVPNVRYHRQHEELVEEETEFNAEAEHVESVLRRDNVKRKSRIKTWLGFSK